MNRTYNCAIALALGLGLAACDTTEQDYRLGDIADIHITTEPTSQVRLGADGTAKEIEIKSNVAWHVRTLGNRFTVSPESGKGDAVLTVTGPINVNEGQSPSETIEIVADDFDKTISLEVLQARLLFNFIDSDTPEAPEEGGDITIKFNSSIGWRLNAYHGQLNWLDFTPGDQGEGAWDEIVLTGTWQPNYTLEPRTVELQLRPQDEEMLKYISLPERVTAVQQAGTLPEVVSATAEYLSETIAMLTIGYKSKAPIEYLGFRVYNYPYTEGDNFVKEVTKEGTDLSQQGSTGIKVTDLQKWKQYVAIPFVKSKVGETVRDTGLVLLMHNPGEPYITGTEVTPTVRSVSATITVESEVELSRGGFSVFTVPEGDGDALYLGTSFVDLIGKDQTFTCEWTNLPLDSNTEYWLYPSIEFISPKTGETVTVRGEKIPFTTLRALTPDENDNKPIY